MLSLLVASLLRRVNPFWVSISKRIVSFLNYWQTAKGKTALEALCNIFDSLLQSLLLQPDSHFYLRAFDIRRQDCHRLWIFLLNPLNTEASSDDIKFLVRLSLEILAIIFEALHRLSYKFLPS